MEENLSEDESVEEKVIRARTVYVLMKEDYRISRNIRASWFFSNLEKVIKFVPVQSLENVEDELTVLSVIPHEDDVPNRPPLSTEFKFQLLPHSNLVFLARRYRMVFVLDLSHSAASVDIRTGEVLLNKIITTLKRCLTGLVKPFVLPGTKLLYKPQLYITVIAHTPLLKCTTNQVLAQGICVDQGNLEEFLSLIKERFDSFETNLASEFAKLQTEVVNTEDDVLCEAEHFPRQQNISIPLNHEAGIINILGQGFFALQLLPGNTSAGICVVTDGSLGVTDSNRFDTLMTQLRNSTISCSFLKMGDTYCARSQLGHIPHVELLQFIATATFGAYFSSCPDLTEDESKIPNVYHKALLQWSFQRGLEGFRYDLTNTQLNTPVHPTALINRILAHPIKAGPSSIVNPIIRKKHKDMKLYTTLSSVLSVRLREGYTIKDVSITKGGTQIEVRLVLPWREYVRIEYCAIASWPLDSSKRLTQVEIMIEGSYDFLHDITCSPTAHRGLLRTTNVKNFWMVLQCLCQDDQLLVHLQSFGSNPVHYKLTESITNGIPVFFLPPNSNNPVLNSQHNIKDSSLNQFATFWKPVVNLDIKIWQKWMHSHRIEMVLEHDIPLPKCLHIPHTTGRFNIVQCRQAYTTLTALMREWSSFILIEGLSYVKLLYEDPEKPPTSFLVLRFTSKPPCFVLRCAFLAGTPGGKRYKTLKELKEKLRNLKFPHRAVQKDHSKRSCSGHDSTKTGVVEHKPPLQLERSEKNCGILLIKPLEQVLISYERKPSDMTELEDPSKYIKSYLPDQQFVNKSTKANAFNTLSRYLHHQRWIWSVKRGKVDINMQAIGRILSTLAKIRLQEGFHFASSNSGIVNMALEISMKDDCHSDNESICVVQYVMFPPHVKTTMGSCLSEDIDEMETTEADGELQIVTECWIEPQHGFSVNNSPERKHWDNMTYKQVAQTFFPVDQECISCLVTFEHLVWVCQNEAMFPLEEFSVLYTGRFIGDEPAYQADFPPQEKTTPANIHQMSFPFDLLSLLPKSQQAEILFSTYMLSLEDEQSSKGSNSILFQLLLDKFSETYQKKVSLSKSDCKRFLELVQKRPRDNTEQLLPFSVEDILSSSDIPQWCCFVRAMSNSRMFMTFLPESFDDLLLLNTKCSVEADECSDSDSDIIIDKLSESQSPENVPKPDSERKKELTHYYTIPFYVYESYQPHVLDMLINPWNFKLPEDMFENLTFPETDKDESFSKMFKVPSFEKEITPGSEEGYLSWMRLNHERRNTECSGGELEANIKQQCTILTDMYYSCFVNGVFQSIQHDLFVHKHDVEAAINNICEESLAIETDITTFLLSSCRHFQMVSDSAKVELVQMDILEKEEECGTLRQSVRFNLEQEPPVEFDVPKSLRLPDTTANLTISLNHACEFTGGSHALVRSKFMDIVQKWFKQVPSNPDYYIYCPETTTQSVSGEESEKNQSDAPPCLESSFSPTEELSFFEDDDLVIVERKHTDPEVLSTASQLDSEESFNEDDFYEEEKDSDNIPLFVFFTCTLRNRLDYHHIAVQGLVPCLDEITSKLGVNMEVNLTDFKVTFDMNCVTMATDIEEEPKITFMRMLSNTSSGSTPPYSPREESIMETSTEIGLQSLGVDPIKHLPRQQHLAVTKCKEELEWLLRDEIASSLRQLQSIQRDTLEYVTQHIYTSSMKGKPNCSYENIPLHFVYGVERSLPKFKEEFERLNLQKYKLIKEEDFYYVVTNKMYTALTKALTSALVELSQENTQASSEMAAFSSKELETSVTYVNPILMTPAEDQKVISPRSLSSKDDRLSPLKDGSEDGLSSLADESAESHYLFPRDTSSNQTTDTIINILNNNDNNPLSESDNFTGFYNKLDVTSINTRPIMSADLRSLSTGEIDLTGMKKAVSCAGLLMSSTSTSKDGSEGSSLAPPLPIKSAVPRLPAIGRLRHASAPSAHGTPLSKNSTVAHTPSWISSRGSYTEEGYEGDSSDNEEGETGFNDLSGLQQQIPKFWLIMKVMSKIKDLGVDVYFHLRETGQEDSEEIIEQRKLVTHVKDSIEKLCFKVNQLLLLNDLYDTRVCKNLLVPEADEDIKWAVDKTLPQGMTILNKSSEDGSEEEEDELMEQQYLYDNLKWDAGHFDCKCVHKHPFLVHSRLKTSSGPQRNSTGIGITALKTVLNKFAVINRKNMFVIKESTTQAVFYLRLKEICGKDVMRQFSTYSVEDIDLGDSSASIIRRDDQLSLAEKDSDTVSIASAGSIANYGKPQDVIELSVHGIEEVGEDISSGLMNTLQNKLDDAVLDILFVQLNRNPMSKLSAEDVHFIQKPSEIKPVSDDTKCPMQIQLTIPVSATMQLSAVVYYLKQNLLQFSYIPNYADSRPENHFQDIIDGSQQAIPDGQAFLYIRPAHGGKGIACISLSLVDGQGKTVHVLSCPKPSRSNYCKITSNEEFDHLVFTELYESIVASGPGPTALLQFRVWEVGSADLGSLKEKLILAVRHSLCDIVTEFMMLTASVCQIPSQLMELLPLPSYSAPSSPRGPYKESDLQRRHSIMTRKMSDKLSLSSNMSSPILQSLKDAFTRVTSPTPDQAKASFDLPSSGSQGSQGQPGQLSPGSSPTVANQGAELEVQQIIHRYEEGSRGILNPIFSSHLIRWYDYCYNLGVPSVSKEEMALASRFAVDYFLKEFLLVVSHILSDVHPKIYKLYRDSDGNLCNGTLYSPLRHPVQTEDGNTETSVDSESVDVMIADQDINFVVVGRNTEQWQASVQGFNEEEFSETPTSPKAIPKQTYQRFPPLLSKREKSTEFMNMMPNIGPVFIPRQRLLVLTIQNRNLSLYTYNWAGDLNKLLINNVRQLVKWNNKRNTLLNSIISQKMGLFHHCPFTQPGKSKNSELENLIKHAAPPPQEHLRRKNSNIGANTSTAHSQPFDEAFKDTQPSKPLMQTQHAAIRDVVKCHGLQTQEVRGHVRKDLETVLTLSRMFWSWFEKSNCVIYINEEDLQLLKQSSRLLHYCATPLLFYCQWRYKVMEKYRSTQRQAGDKNRSRHSSGTSTSSMRTKRADSQEGKKRPDSTPSDSPVHGSKVKSNQEEMWHVELRSKFITEYINYVKSIGFVTFLVNPRKRHTKTPSGEKTASDDSNKTDTIDTVHHLQKTMSGGIILMELSFKEQYFCVKLYICECSRLGTPVNKHLKLLFVDECEKCKDLIHVHSFAHDFHLRSIQSIIKGETKFKQFYHLTGFLSDFSLVYPYPPGFARNYLLTDYIIFHELSSPAHVLYEHMTRHIKDHGMKVISMTPTVDADIDSEYYFVKTTEFALTQFKEYKSQSQRTEDFDIGLVITNMSQSNLCQTEAEKYTLKLQYFIVLTSKRDLFPVAYLEKKLGQFKSSIIPQLSEILTSSNPVPVKQHIGVRKESSKRTNLHQETAENILVQESNKAREKMNELIRKSIAECRKDSLWNRMLIVTHVEEDSKRKKRSDTEDSKDGYHQKLTHAEFLELLRMVVKTRLSDLDPQLMPFHNMNLLFYKSLYKVLQSRYPETHRCFSSPDGHVQYLVIINPKFPDMMMMLMIDNKDNKTDLCAVYREVITDITEGPLDRLLSDIQNHQTDFINVCCFHLWASLL